MAEAGGIEPAASVRLRARLLEFLKFRVLAAQESFFSAFRLDPAAASQGGAADQPADHAADQRSGPDHRPQESGGPQGRPSGAGEWSGPGLEPLALDPARLRAWLGPLWPEALALCDRELQETFVQAHRLYVN